MLRSPHEDRKGQWHKNGVGSQLIMSQVHEKARPGKEPKGSSVGRARELRKPAAFLCADRIGCSHAQGGKGSTPDDEQKVGKRDTESGKFCGTLYIAGTPSPASQ